MCGDPDDSFNTRNQSATTLGRTRTQQWQRFLPHSDISNCIALSKLRCVITLVSLVLLMTDIPRTGLGVHNLQEYYPVPLMPSTAVRFGPFNYPVVHIWRSDNANSSTNSTHVQFAALKGTQPIPAARVWSYQYDTSSVGLRGAVELLNVTEFPSFLLYKPQTPKGQPKMNADSLLDLATAFTMLDAFIDTARKELRPTSNTLRYATKHNWIDRMHHYIVRAASKNPAWRLHSLHVPTVSRDTKSPRVCASAASGQRAPPRPRFCNHPGIWKCANPLNASASPVRLWDHMDLRLQSLQQRYPDLDVDVALVSSQRLSSTSGALRSTFYNYEALEVVVLTRGRRCINTNTSSEPSSTACSTVFVDDYRYERDIVQTNLVDWYGIISMLRGGAQTYVWVRLGLLVYGAYVASIAGPGSRLVSTALIVFKIPFQVIVYSSSLPVAGYVLALVLDSSFMDIFLDSYWASVGGAVNFKLVPFLRTTAVQMRGVWLLALLASVMLFAMRRSRSHGDGIPGVRGLLISFASSLTVFGPYKSVHYRDMNITSIFEIPNEGQILDFVRSSNPDGCFNLSSYFYGGSSRTVRLCVSAVAIVVLVFKILGYLTPRICSLWNGKSLDQYVTNHSLRCTCSFPVEEFSHNVASCSISCIRQGRRPVPDYASIKYLSVGLLEGKASPIDYTEGEVA
ncbi:hypothetical protein PF005_g22484 [Phytophthora fragariae]|uniref:Uncharacterized protein n=1 Tax=Phytophthora fragariae TaxID=53985 RepID=A0A6A3WC49_9STRA|nr:hypothetical protein PF009_g22869 [Phytophthora fragariae]KAE9082899.1 hypothetical protein PF007_g22126 [Phytophthora fragariae]KAE9107523.1 hypothetical protein PF006_g21092 [Phytophthora fragariae]KAE9182451.1 hypothetical protein PF005_g22484 [Phytophthora fragariae]KAE9232829.1 hypothetical protein PF002_g12266 [Phytophthora fragariae]